VAEYGLQIARGGVLLSSAAASDLSEMMTSFRKQTYRRRIQKKCEKISRAKKLEKMAHDAKLKKMAAPPSDKSAGAMGAMPPAKTLLQKVPKVGTMTYLRQPPMRKARGRRGS